VTLSLFHKIDSRLRWGSSLVLRPNEGFSPILALGLQYGISKASSVKVKGDNNGALAVAFEHRLKDPNLKFNVAAEYNVAKPFGAARHFGMSLAYGH